MQFFLHGGVGWVAVEVFCFQRVGLEVDQLPDLGVVLRVVEADQLVLLGADGILSTDRVVTGVFVVVVVVAVAPVTGGLALQDGYKRPALHGVGRFDAGEIKEGLCEVQRRNDVAVDTTWLDVAGPADDQRGAERFFVDPTFVVPAMLAEVEPLVGAVDDNGVVGQVVVLQVFHHATDVLVDRFDAGEVGLQVALMHPADTIFFRHLGQRFFERGIFFREHLAVGARLLLVESARNVPACLIVRALSKVLGDGHLLVLAWLDLLVVVFEERGGLGDRDPFPGLVDLRLGAPLAVRGLVLAHEHEGLTLVAPALEPVEGEIGNDVGGIAGMFFFGALLVVAGAVGILEHHRVVVWTLAREDFGVVVALWCLVRAEMPLADDGGLVARLLQEFGKGGLVDALELVAVAPEPVDVRVLAGLNDGSHRPTDRVGDHAAVKTHALVGELVEVGRADGILEVAVVGADRLVGVVICKDEDDVGPLCLGRILRGGGACG